MSTQTHTIQLIDNRNSPGSIDDMPLRIKICDLASGHVFTIQAVPGGIRVSVNDCIVVRPNATNAIDISEIDF